MQYDVFIYMYGRKDDDVFFVSKSTASGISIRYKYARLERGY